MAITLPTSFTPLEPASFGASAPVISDNEAALQHAVHHLWGYMTPPVVLSVQNLTGLPYVGSDSGDVNGAWAIEVVPPWTHYRVDVYAQNTGAATPADDGVLYWSWSTPPAAATTLTIPGATAQWTAFSFTIAAPAIAGLQRLRVIIEDGASGAIRLHSVTVRPEPLASLPAWDTGEEFFALDDQELADDSPLTVAHRRFLFMSLEAIRLNRFGSVVGWCDALPPRGSGKEPYITTATTSTLLIRLAFYAPVGCTELRWSVLAEKLDAGDGTVTIQVEEAADAGEADTEITIATGALASPYETEWMDYTDAGAAAIAVQPGAWQNLRVSAHCASAGSIAIYGLSLWLGVTP